MSEQSQQSPSTSKHLGGSSDLSRDELVDEFAKFLKSQPSKLIDEQRAWEEKRLIDEPEPLPIHPLTGRVGQLEVDATRRDRKVVELYQLNEAVCAREAQASDRLRKIDLCLKHHSDALGESTHTAVLDRMREMENIVNNSARHQRTDCGKITERLDQIRKDTDNAVQTVQRNANYTNKRLEKLNEQVGGGHGEWRRFIGERLEALEVRLEKKGGTNSYEAMRMSVMTRLRELEQRSPDPVRGSALPSQPVPADQEPFTAGAFIVSMVFGAALTLGLLFATGILP